MFKNKYLKQLQCVQEDIRTCGENIYNLLPPKPVNEKIHSKIMWTILDRNIFDVENFFASVLSCAKKKNKDEVVEYLRTLGEYFVQISDVYFAEQKYKSELEQLLQEELRLKNKLGIR